MEAPRSAVSMALPIPPVVPVRHRSRTHGAEHDRLTPLQRRVLVGAIAAAHGVALWALLQVREVRDAVAEVAPMFVSLVAPPAPPQVDSPPPPPPAPLRRATVPAPRVVAAPPSPGPIVVAPAPAEAPVEVAPPPAVAAAVAPVPAPPPPAAPPVPRTIPASAVQYLEPLPLEYPRVSKRLGETGRVVVRVFIDEAGRAREARVERPSGHVRLDDAALAAVGKARFRPYTENGQPVAGWAVIPIDFELER